MYIFAIISNRYAVCFLCVFWNDTYKYNKIIRASNPPLRWILGSLIHSSNHNIYHSCRSQSIFWNTRVEIPYLCIHSLLLALHHFWVSVLIALQGVQTLDQLMNWMHIQTLLDQKLQTPLNIWSTLETSRVEARI